MKKNQNNYVVNYQEDEDGFNLNPYNIFISNQTDGKSGLPTPKKIKISTSGNEKHRVIYPNKTKEKESKDY